MSRASVRAAVATWFQPPAVTGLNRIYRSEPKNIPASEYFAGSSGAGAVGFVYIEREHEARIAMGGAHSGKKQATYDIGLVVLFHSVLAGGEEAMDAYDAMVEVLKERLRSDRTLGTDGTTNPIFQAGESAGSDIEIISDLPKRNNEAVDIWSVLRFQVIEILTT